MPAWAQIYAVWGVAAVITLGIIFFTSVERTGGEIAPAMSVAVNGFADGLFYELRDSDADSQPQVIREYGERLEKKHGYKLREETLRGCKLLHLTRGSLPAYYTGAVSDGEKSQAAFALLTFLDRAATANPEHTISGMIIFAAKNCDAISTAREAAASSNALAVLLSPGEADNAYAGVFHLRDLKLRRHFETAFLTRERTLWTDVLAMLSGTPQPLLQLPAKAAWATGTEAMLMQNPLLHHPVFIRGNVLTYGETALYLAENTQLHKGGFIALLILVWLLAFLPLVNAMGAFKERVDFGSALTSAVLYAAAFFLWYGIAKTILHFTKTDFAAVALMCAVLPVIFFPVRILQRSLLRAELNRAALHLLLQLLLTVSVFINPLAAICGLILLTLLSGFLHASIGRKLLRLLFVVLFFAACIFAAGKPLGSFVTFFSALLPAFSLSQTGQIILLSLIGGNLVALLFVPRERV